MKEATEFFEKLMLKKFNEGKVEGAKELPKLKEVFKFKQLWFADYGDYFLSATQNEIENV